MNQTAKTISTLGPRRRDPAQKRELLLTAARDLFWAQGFDRTSTRQVAECAGVSEGILFHQFGSKKGLFECLADDFAHAAAAASMPTGSQAVTEESVVRGAFDFAEAQPVLYDLLNSGSAETAGIDMSAYTNIIIDTIVTSLDAAMAAGQIRQGNPRIMAELQFAIVDAAITAWRRKDKKEPAALREDYIQEAVLCMRAMLAPTDSQFTDRPAPAGEQQ